MPFVPSQNGSAQGHSRPSRSLYATSSNVQIQPTNVRTRKGYAKNGSGEEVGNTCSPHKILAAVIAKRIAATVPTRRIQLENSLGTPVSSRAADHKAVPAANEGTLSARVAAVPESITPSPIANTRNPAATQSLPFLKNLKARRVVATTRPTASIPHEAARRFWAVTRGSLLSRTPHQERGQSKPRYSTDFSFCGLMIHHTQAPNSRIVGKLGLRGSGRLLTFTPPRNFVITRTSSTPPLWQKAFPH